MTPDTPSSSPAPARRGWLPYAGALASVVILALSAYVVSRTLKGLDWSALGHAIKATSTEQFLMSGAFAAGSYLALTAYDWIALRHLRERVPYRTLAFASFVANSLSMTLGFALLTGGSVRYWIYSRAGVSAKRVAAAILLVSFTYWMGVGTVVGLGLLLRPDELASVNQLKASVNVAIGAALAATLLAWIAWVSIRVRRVSVRGLVVEAPRTRWALAQILAGSADVCCGAGALFALMPSGHGLDFLSFAPTFVASQVLGVASNVPGGVGPFEAAMLNAIWRLPAEVVLASLLMYRIVYFLIPFMVGLALLGAHEVRARWGSPRAQPDSRR